MPSAAPTPAVELIGIDKRFGAVHANRDVSLAVAHGSIHGIVGENGAGKSTLMSILYGFYQADRGEIRVKGRPCRIASPSEAIAAGIGMVHQHFMLVEPFTALENVVLGAEGGALLAPALGKARRRLEVLARDFGLAVPLDVPVAELTVGQQQRVEILKALFREADVLILDEPTGVLTPGEADHLFEVLAELRRQGKTVILITHKLREIMAVTDRVSVMRRGELIATRETGATTPGELAELMVGRGVRLEVERRERPAGAAILEVTGLGCREADGTSRLADVSFTVREGEIVGVAGVAGNGQSELLDVLAGIRPRSAGEVRIDGRDVAASGSSPARLRGLRLAHVPEDRQRRGLVMSFDAAENSILGYHGDRRYARHGLLDRSAILAEAGERMAAFDVRPRDPALRVALLSGGNQQKLVLARELEREPRLLIIGQPTRGVDIGAIAFIHKRLLELRDQGKAILIVSVELDEIRALADRVLVMFAGRIAGTCAPDVSDHRLGLLMAGITEPEGRPA